MARSSTIRKITLITRSFFSSHYCPVPLIHNIYRGRIWGTLPDRRHPMRTGRPKAELVLSTQEREQLQSLARPAHFIYRRRVFNCRYEWK